MKTLFKVFALSFFMVLFFITGCEQNTTTPVDQTDLQKQDLTMSTDQAFLDQHTNCSWRTLLELIRARIATARYRNINNAIQDGYEDINVIVPHMGYHYLKAQYLDATFEVRKPELLVYSPNPTNGNMRLVAVEYAVPISLSQDPPEGFTGDSDVWDFNETFQLWTLHAWVWYYNPDGVFNPTNPLIP